MARGVLHKRIVDELMTKYKRDDIEVSRQDERDLRRALEAAKDVSFLVLALCLSIH